MDYAKTDIKVQTGPDITGLLQQGEHVIWQGQTGAQVAAISTRSIAQFSAIIIGAAIVTELIGSNVDFFPGFGLVAGIYGTGLIIGLLAALIVNVNQSSTHYDTRYFLTNQRAVIIRGPLPDGGYRTTLTNLAQVEAIGLSWGPDGSGSITFGRKDKLYVPRYGYINDPDYTFSNIPDVEHVYQLVQGAQQTTTNQLGQ